MKACIADISFASFGMAALPIGLHAERSVAGPDSRRRLARFHQGAFYELCVTTHAAWATAATLVRRQMLLQGMTSIETK